LAGDIGSEFLGMTADLGIGFYALIAYSVFAAILQYIFNSAASETYSIDPFHKIDYWWTPLFRCTH
jgi:hypothetical protein